VLEDFDEAVSEARKVYLLHAPASFDFLPVNLLEGLFLDIEFEILD
jgi:hypothetical protein